MVGAFGQQAFQQLEAVGNGAFDQLGIVIGREGVTAAGQRVAELVDGNFFQGTAGAGRDEDQTQRDRVYPPATAHVAPPVECSTNY